MTYEIYAGWTPNELSREGDALVALAEIAPALADVSAGLEKAAGLVVSTELDGVVRELMAAMVSYSGELEALEDVFDAAYDRVEYGPPASETERLRARDVL